MAAMHDSDLRSWRGPAVLGHPWWEGQPFYGAFRFDARTEADAIRQASEAYNFVYRPQGIHVDVMIAKDADEQEKAHAAFVARKSDVLKICPMLAEPKGGRAG